MQLESKEWLSKQLLKQQPVGWDLLELKSRVGSHTLIDAKTFTPPLLLDTKPIRLDADKSHAKHVKWSSDKSMGYANLLVPKGLLLELFTKRPSYILFNEDVVVPALLGEDLSPWMSLTPGEMLSLQSGVRRATGKVVVGGLGLGYLLVEICKKKTVKEIMVVERSAATIELVWEPLLARYPVVREKKVTIVQDDVYKVADKCPPSTRFILDIWPSFGAAANDDRLLKLTKKFKYVWAWGDVAW